MTSRKTDGIKNGCGDLSLKKKKKTSTKGRTRTSLTGPFSLSDFVVVETRYHRWSCIGRILPMPPIKAEAETDVGVQFSLDRNASQTQT